MHVHIFQGEITSFMVIQQSPYMYVGHLFGNVSVLKLDKDACHLVHMQYNIPFAVSHGNYSLGGTTEVANGIAVMYILPQPMAESRRVLIIFRDGFISLWGIQESKTLFRTGGNMRLVMRNEEKKVVSACWACPIGSKVAVGYSNGDIFIWGVPKASDTISSSGTDDKEISGLKNVPLLKLNLGYKMDKVPIVSLRWVFADGRASRLYVNGVSELGSSSLFQVIILNENTESRTIKLVLPLPEACIDMEIVSNVAEHNKHKENALLLLLRSGCLRVYDDSEIEHYLLQCHSKSVPPVPRQITMKLPFGDSNITVAQYITESLNSSSYKDEDHKLSTKDFYSFIPPDLKEADRNCSSSARFNGFSKANNLYITGHYDGAINFWDASCPLLVQIFSIKQKSEDDRYLRETPVTALCFDTVSKILVSGFQNGLVCIFQLKGTQSTTDNIFSILQAKRGCNYIVNNVKLNGAILAISMRHSSGLIAVGTDKGYVSIIEMKGMSVLYEKRVPCELSPGIISLQFDCSLSKSEENVLLVALDDSSVFAFEVDKGNALSASVVHPKRPTRALFMQILEELDLLPRGLYKYDCSSESKRGSVKSNAPNGSLLLLCSERSIRIYSLVHVFQGIKKVYHKKTLHGTCCWASTFHSPDIGLVLIFACGKIEIRSLPDLALLKETSLRGFTFPTINSGSSFSVSLCASSDGEVIAAMGNQEIFFFSALFQKDIYRLLESVSQVYKKDMIVSLEGPSSAMQTHKEKKSGLFNVVIREIKGKKQGQGMENVDSDASIGEELSIIFSTVNFPLNLKNSKSMSMGDDDVELNIDDINLEDPSEKTKGHDFPLIDKQKLGKKMQEFKDKLKSKTAKKAEASGNEEHGDGKSTDAVDRIKRKYGFPLSGELSVPKMAQSKLSENLSKLQGINMRTAEMQDTARSFSSLAKELLSTVEKEKRMS
uniref:F-box/WD repeat-containing protein 10 n=1 Tax=Anthurium amnicola TaxID=1678845 RepID=A0A1D1YUL6_9ARAE